MITRRKLHGLTALVISLGCLLLPIGSRPAGLEKRSENLSRIRVEDCQGFTRIVFPCSHPEASSVEPDLERRRFVVKLPGTEAGTALPDLGRGHPLIKGIDVQIHSGEDFDVEVILTTPSVDWVSYRYDHPSRTVLYLRARPDAEPSQRSPLEVVPSRTEEEVAEKPAPPAMTVDEEPARPQKAPDIEQVPNPGGETSRHEKGEDLWRTSVNDIPEFVSPGLSYPPDVHEMTASERDSYRRALESFRNRDFVAAKETASRIVPQDARSSVAEILAFFKADCDFQMADEKERQPYLRALRSYQEAMTRFPKSAFAPQALLAIGSGYRKMQFYQEAMVQYQWLLKEFPGSPPAAEALFWQGECFFQMGKYKEAKEVFEAFVGKRPRTVHGRIAALRIGDCLYQLGDPEGAERQYGAVLSESSDLSCYPLNSLFFAGLSFLRDRHFERGREILFKAVNLDPSSDGAGDMIEAVAQSYLDEKRPEEALRVNLLWCESFAGENPAGKGWVQLADLRLSQPSLKWPPLCVDACLDPVRVYQEFLDRSQDMDRNEQVMYRYALALVERGDLGRAAVALKQVISQAPQGDLRRRSADLLSHCLNSLVQRHHGQGEFLQVLRLYQDHRGFLQHEDNREKEGLLLVAESLQNLGLLEDALAVYGYLRGGENVAQDHMLFQIGRIQSTKGDKSTARATLEELHTTYPQSPYLAQAQELLGDHCLEMKDYGEAVKWYRLALSSGKLGLAEGKVYTHLGESLEGLDHRKEAMEAYRQAVAATWVFREQEWAKKLLSTSLVGLAQYWDDHGQRAKAVESYEKIVELSPSDDQVNWALYRLGETHRKMGNAELMQQARDDLNNRSVDSLWTRLAAWSAKDATLEAEAGPYLTRLRQDLGAREKK